MECASHLVDVSGGSRGGTLGGPGLGPCPLILAKKIKNNEKMQKEEKPAEQAIFANQFCFKISKKLPPPPPSSRSGSATGRHYILSHLHTKPTEIFNTTCHGHLNIMFCRKVDRLLSLGNLVPKQLKNLIINSS